MTEPKPAFPFEPEVSNEGRWSQFALALTLLQTELLAIASAIAFMSSATPGAQLLARNAWETQERNRVLVVWAILAVIVGASTAGAAFKWGLDRLTRVARILLPLVPLSFLPFLLTTEYWFHQQLPFLVLLVLFGFVAEACLSRSLDQFSAPLGWGERLATRLNERAPWLPLATVITAAVAYAGYTGYLTVLNHMRWGTGAFDLGIFNNVMFNTYKGYPFRTTIMVGSGSTSFLLCHTPYLAYLLLPFYAIYPAAESLLCIQAALLGSGAIFLFLFARTQIRAGYAVVLSLLYLLFAPMHGAQFYDFHFLTIASPFLFFFFYALAKARTWMVVLSTVLLWLLREDMAPGMALLGLILLLSGKRPKTGLLITLGSVIWFAINKFVIMPSFGTWWFANLYENLATPEEKGYGSVVKTLLVNPLYLIPTLLNEGKLIYLLHLLVPVAVIPLRRMRLAILLIPGALFTVMTNAGANFSIRYQYSSHYAAYIFAAVTFYFLEFQKLSHATPAGALPTGALRHRSFSTLMAMCLCTICHSATYGVIIKPSSFVGGAFPVAFSLTAEEKLNLAAFNELESLIPKTASVTCTTKDAPHLSNRLDIHAFSHSHADGQYLLINPSSFGMGSTNNDILQAINSGKYGFLKKARGITLWKQGHSSRETEQEIRKLQRKLGHRPQMNRR